MSYEFLKWLHILSAILLFGTGFGSAFYKFMADRSGNLTNIAITNRHVVLADWIFTTPTVLLQPITGVLLAQARSYPMLSGWLAVATGLFVFAGLCWLPVVWLQIRMRNDANAAMNGSGQLPERYWRDARLWFWLGIPAFCSMVVVVWLMIAKPVIEI